MDILMYMNVFLCRMVIVVNLNDPVEGKEDHRIAIWDEH